MQRYFWPKKWITPFFLFILKAQMLLENVKTFGSYLYKISFHTCFNFKDLRESDVFCGKQTNKRYLCNLCKMNHWSQIIGKYLVGFNFLLLMRECCVWSTQSTLGNSHSSQCIYTGDLKLQIHKQTSNFIPMIS